MAAGSLLACSGDPQPIHPILQNEQPKASIFAVGDTGRPHNWLPELFEGQIAVANGMEAEDTRAPVDALVLLGDNFYDSGLIRETMPDQLRENVVYPYCRFVALDGPRSEEVNSVCAEPGNGNPDIQILAVLGNHDLGTAQSPELQCQEADDFVSNWYMPCSFAKTIELDNGISVILFDAERRGNKKQIDLLEKEVRNSKGPWRVVASHRPITMDDDSRPLDRGGWLDRLVKRAGVPVHAVVSGHHHNLQLFDTPGPGPNLHAVAGSGARARARQPDAIAHPARRFGASELGFARIDVIGPDDDERLVVSLFSTPEYPFLQSGHPELVARWSVDHEGNTRDELTPEETE